MSSSLYAGSLFSLPMLAACSYCSTAAVYCPEDLHGKHHVSIIRKGSTYDLHAEGW